MIGKNGIDWDAMGFTVYGECPAYGSTKYKRNKASNDSKRNITFTPAYKLWSRLIQKDRGNDYPRITLCEEWKDFYNFEKWYNENYYDVLEERMDFSYTFFNMDNTYVSAETSCFLPNSILFVNKMDCRLTELVEKYKDKMPEKVRKQCEKLCEELKNSYGKVE